MLMIIGGVEDEDMGLVAQELPNNFKLLNVPNVVISDSGATWNFITHYMGSTKTRTSSKCNEIQTADGAIMQAKIIGNIPVV